MPKELIHKQMNNLIKVSGYFKPRKKKVEMDIIWGEKFPFHISYNSLLYLIF